MKNKWIPCNERMPKDTFDCIVTVANECIDGFYFDSSGGFALGRYEVFPHTVWWEREDEAWYTYHITERISCDVVAWMKLPEPYEENNNDSNQN